MRQSLTQQRPAGVALPDSVGECRTGGMPPARGTRRGVGRGVVRSAGSPGIPRGCGGRAAPAVPPAQPARPSAGSAVSPAAPGAAAAGPPRGSSRTEAAAAPQHPLERGAVRPLPSRTPSEAGTPRS